MPQAGQTMEEGTIVKWHVERGTRIAKGDIIFEVETDKSVVEVEAVDAGRLARIVVGEGKTVAVLTPVAYLGDNDADVDRFLAGTSSTAAPSSEKVQRSEQIMPTRADTNVPTARARPGEGRIKASPAARKLARERGIDLSQIASGSGPGGRIVLKDIPVSATPAPGTGEGQPIRRPISAMRKAIARNLSVSKQTIPHFYMRVTIDAEPMIEFCRAKKVKYRCTLPDVIVQACARAIQEFPAFRSRLEDDQIVEFPRSNIGLAVAVDDGLVVPVVIGADQMNLEQLAGVTRQIVEAARGGTITGLGRGGFTVTNLGMFGIEEFSAIINPPEPAILAVGAAREAVIVRSGTMRPGRVMTMTLSCDHRIIDGLTAAKFMERLKELLERPRQLAGG